MEPLNSSPRPSHKLLQNRALIGGVSFLLGAVIMYGLMSARASHERSPGQLPSGSSAARRFGDDDPSLGLGQSLRGAQNSPPNSAGNSNNPPAPASPGNSLAPPGFPPGSGLALGDDPLAQMRRMREQMMRQMQQAMLGDDLDSLNPPSADEEDSNAPLAQPLPPGARPPARSHVFQLNTGQAGQREDAQFVYYDIPIQGLDRSKLKVQIEDGQINLDGQSDNHASAGSGFSFTSRFHRSFPVPEGVDATKMQMAQDSEKLTLKFPKNHQ